MYIMPSFIRSSAGILGNLVKGMNLLIENKMITPERKDELITEFKTLASNASSIHHVQTLAEEFRIKHNIPRVTSASTTASTTASTAGISSELASVQDIEQIDRDIEQIDQAIEEERKKHNRDSVIHAHTRGQRVVTTEGSQRRDQNK